MFYWTNNYSQLRNTSELLHIQIWWMEFSFIFLGFSWFPGTVLHPGIQWWIRPLTHNSHTTVHEITRKMVLAVYLWCFGSVWKNVSNICLITNIGEGGGTPLQYSCLENPMDGGAWWAAVHEVAKSQTRLSNFTFMHWRRKWQPTPVFFPGESQGQRSLVGGHLWGRTEPDTTEAT